MAGNNMRTGLLVIPLMTAACGDAAGPVAASLDASTDVVRLDVGADGDGADREPPATIVDEVALGDAHTCARLAETTVRCWGSDRGGQLGDGTMTNHPSPVPVVS